MNNREAQNRRPRGPDGRLLAVTWSPEDERRFAELYPVTPNRQLATRFGLALNTIGIRACERGLRKAPGGTARALPIGTFRVNAYGQWLVKVAEGGGSKAWHFAHTVLWEKAHGPIPKGHRLRFKDRDRMNCSLENLELISDEQNMLRNTIHNYPMPVKDAMRWLAKLKKAIDEKQTDGSS